MTASPRRSNKLPHVSSVATHESGERAPAVCSQTQRQGSHQPRRHPATIALERLQLAPGSALWREGQAALAFEASSAATRVIEAPLCDPSAA
jgi:hypothetical protein